METLADRVRLARTLVGLNQSELAKQCGVGRAAISKIESGLSKGMSLDTAVAIQRVTGVSAAWIRTGKGNMRDTVVRDEQIARIADKLATLPPRVRDKIEADVDFLNGLQEQNQ